LIDEQTARKGIPMSKKRVVATSFTPTPDWLRTWVEDKDRTYWSPEKHARGIQSYSLALKSLEDYFKAIKIGSLKPNQRSIAYFAKVWGWNWTKTLRFFVAVMEALENLDSRFQYFKKKAQEYAEKAKQYVYKARGKEYRGKHTTDTSKSDESELEEAFLDAMVALGSKSNPAYYREKIKQNLRAGDKATLENFAAWKAKRVAEAEERKAELKKESFDFETILKQVRIEGQSILRWTEYESYFDVYLEGETLPRQVNKEQIVKTIKGA